MINVISTKRSLLTNRLFNTLRVNATRFLSNAQKDALKLLLELTYPNI